MAASFLFSSFLLLLALCCGHAAAQNQTSSLHEGCIHLPVIHSTNVNYFAKRGVQLQLANRSDVAYYAQLSIGTPPQPVFVQLDTGSFELWVNPDCNTVSGPDAVFCQRIGQYDMSKSSTGNSLGTTKQLRYGIGSANITYVTDTISLAGSKTALQDVQFGVATSSEDAFSGILGVGYGDGIATKYLNFVDQLAIQNATRVKAYTIALGSKDAEEGVIVFGGVDTSKFGGALARLPIIPADQSPDLVPRFWIDMDSVSISPPSEQTREYAGSTMPVFLDSGSTMTLLPTNLTLAIASDFGSPAADANGFFRVDCALTEVEGSLDFAFDGVTVKVPYKELIREVPGSPPACFLGISPSESFTLLGDTFMRSAYTVFDLESNAIWMTQAANCGSTPAVLNNVSDLSRVTGACGLEPNSGVTAGSSAGSPVSDLGSGATGSTETGSTSRSQAPVSGAASAVSGALGLWWSLGITVVVSQLI
ncbi:aspartic peptidase domain-containing protein [Bombardia bombarda]|uniref:Aspartic peptidase domain-containing protein n=1 Tax=Bombardia bombarda TaxID=252184 RepID=A0AA39XQB5_9PEZI|nr:aspartic peptidase domain-containing protein [Bombardia bombarda]